MGLIMAVLVNAGRAAIALSVKAQAIHLAWGSGNSSWDTTPQAEDITQTALVAEVGRRTATQLAFCTPDSGGGIIVPTGSFSISSTPTNNLYMKFSFDFTDSPSATIRELGVFVGTQTNPSLPSGQQYFQPSDIVNPGTLLVLENISKLVRSASVRQMFEFVVTF
jgi:hypothetical protein